MSESTRVEPVTIPSNDRSLSWRDLALWLVVACSLLIGTLVMGLTGLALPVGMAFSASISLYGLLTWVLRPTVVDRSERPGLWSLLLAFRFGLALMPLAFFVAMYVITSLPFGWPVLLVVSLVVPMGMMFCQALLRPLYWDPIAQADDTTASDRRFALWMGADISLCNTVLIRRMGREAWEEVKIGGSVELSALPSPKTIASVKIGPGVTSIAEGAFDGCTSLISVEIPTGVTSIKYSAFRGCTSLISVEIPTGVTSIETQVFRGCTSLISVAIPSGVERIGWSAFAGCTSLISVEIPTGVKSIERYAFSGCTSLISVAIPTGVTSIAEGAFDSCTSLISVAIPIGVRSIEDHAFSGCTSLISVEIPTGVKSIERYAFSGCTSLISVEIPTGVTSIKYSAFGGCTSLISVAIPTGVKSIETEVFRGCTSLISVAIPSGVERIGWGAFAGCTSLISVEIPTGVTSIKDHAFRGCISLSSVVIPYGVTSIEGYAFSGCTSLSSVEIPIGVRSIEDHAFSDCTNLSEVKLPAGVQSIERYAFSGCTSLRKVEIPSSVRSIDSSAFANVGACVIVRKNSTAFNRCWVPLQAVVVDDQGRALFVPQAMDEHTFESWPMVAQVGYAKAKDMSFSKLSHVSPLCAKFIATELLSVNPNVVDLCLLSYLGCADIGNLGLALRGSRVEGAIHGLRDHARVHLMLELAKYSNPETAVDMLQFTSCLLLAASVGLRPERHRRSILASQGYKDCFVNLKLFSETMNKAPESVDASNEYEGDDDLEPGSLHSCLSSPSFGTG